MSLKLKHLWMFWLRDSLIRNFIQVYFGITLVPWEIGNYKQSNITFSTMSTKLILFKFPVTNLLSKQLFCKKNLSKSCCTMVHYVIWDILFHIYSYLTFLSKIDTFLVFLCYLSDTKQIYRRNFLLLLVCKEKNDVLLKTLT